MHGHTRNPRNPSLTLDGFERVWEAQLTLRALPAMGLPGLAVTTGLVDNVPLGVPVMPVDPVV